MIGAMMNLSNGEHEHYRGEVDDEEEIRSFYEWKYEHADVGR